VRLSNLRNQPTALHIKWIPSPDSPDPNPTPDPNPKPAPNPNTMHSTIGRL